MFWAVISQWASIHAEGETFVILFLVISNTVAEEIICFAPFCMYSFFYSILWDHSFKFVYQMVSVCLPCLCKIVFLSVCVIQH